MKRQGIKALAEVNEYMYNQLKENGIAVKMVHNIATAFFDLGSTTESTAGENRASAKSISPSQHSDAEFGMSCGSG